jgi:hypothetical protein
LTSLAEDRRLLYPACSIQSVQKTSLRGIPQ